MVVCLAIVTPLIGFTPPRPWALGFADGPRIAMAGDVDHDGFADMIAVYPVGDCIIDVSPSNHGWKTEGGHQALTNWGKNCQAATVGEFDATPGDDVVGIFDGRTLRLAGAYSHDHFVDVPSWVSLPEPLPAPKLVTLQGGKTILAFSTKTGAGYVVDSTTKAVSPCRLPAGMRWMGDAGKDLVGQTGNGEIYWIDRTTFKKKDKLGAAPIGSTPAASDGVVAYGDKAWTTSGTFPLEAPNLPKADVVRVIGDVDGDGDPDILEFRHGSELHTGNQVLLRRAISAGETDVDHDGLSDDEEKRLGTDPYDPDTDHDGLLDGWEVHGFRGLDLKALGCDPKHADTVCLISRFDAVKETLLKSEMDHVIQFYAALKVANPDGKNGISFHPVYLEPVTGAALNDPWWTNRARFRPEKWRGVVHWMQVTPGGGGQADELGDGGGCGQNALWAVFVHEFGHQLGLNHEGFWQNGSCPIYSSLMNYNYSYGYEDDRNKIHYSDGSLKAIVLRETDLDETLPYPYEKVKFLERGPYHYRLKPNGNTTLIDWNWNGVFGEKHVRASINYAYGTTAGTRQNVGKTKTAPWLFTHRNTAYLLCGTNDLPVDLKVSPNLSVNRPGSLFLKRLKRPTNWDSEWTIESGGVAGDPVAASFGGKIVAVYQTLGGVVMRRIDVQGAELSMSQPLSISTDPTLVPTVGEYKGRLYVFLWNGATSSVSYQVMSPDGKLGKSTVLNVPSVNPVGMCTDTLTGQAVLGLAQNQDKGRTNRWQIRHFEADANGVLSEVGKVDWVDGENGGSRGNGRLIVLFDASKAAGEHGRVYLFGKGLTSDQSPWACAYVAQQIADKTMNGGWLVKRYYDEWTQTRSAPAVAWFGDDLIYAFQWTDGGQGAGDNGLTVAYAGLGIQSEPMGDHDDISFIRNFGLQNSLLALGRE